MKEFDLKNNALFLACYYERFRPVQTVCFLVFLCSALLLAFFICAVGSDGWAETLGYFFYVIVWTQVIMVIISGALAAGYMGARERVSGTLDFHRASPDAAGLKVMGLIVGSTWFEWVVFACCGIAEILLAILIERPVWPVVLFNLSLMISGLFFHCAAAVFSLRNTSKNRRSSLIGLLLILLVLPHVAVSLSRVSALLIYLSGISGLAYIYPDFFSEGSAAFYLPSLPHLLLQWMIQFPLIIFFLKGMYRIFHRPNSPVWTKQDILRFAFFIFFIIAGFFVGQVIQLGTPQGMHKLMSESSFDPLAFNLSDKIRMIFENHSAFFISFTTLLGVAMAFYLSPSYFGFLKYVVLSRKRCLHGTRLFHDGFSNYPSLIVYGGVSALFFSLYASGIQASWQAGVLAFLLVFSYVAAFHGFLEFFRFSRFRANKIFFATVVSVAWIFVPLMVMVLCYPSWETCYLVTSISPFVGISHGISHMFGNEKNDEWLILLVPWGVAILAYILAYQERRKVRETIEHELEMTQQPAEKS